MQTDTNTGEGRVWLVTGTSSGFGRAIARAALSRGDTVVGTARRAGRLDDLIREAPEDKAHALSLDLTDTKGIQRVVEQVLDHDIVTGVASSTYTAAFEACTKTGTTGDDFLDGTSSADVICGMGGSDTIEGMQGNDVLRGGGGTDKVNGGTGADDLYGAGGNDAVNSRDGVSGNDSLAGGSGTDTKITDATEKSIVGIP